MVHKALKALKVNLVRKVPLAIKVHKEPMVPKVLKVPKVTLDPKVLMEIWDHKEPLVTWVLRVLLVKWVLEANQAQTVLRVLRANKEITVLLAVWVLKAQLDRLVHKEPLVKLETKDHRAPPVKKACLVIRDLLVSPVLRVLKVLKAQARVALSILGPTLHAEKYSHLKDASALY
jgi:hypothetical protein